MRYKYLFISFILFLIISGCTQKSTDPKNVLNGFFNALSTKDFETAKKLSTAESKTTLDLLQLFSNMDATSTDAIKFDKSNIQISESVLMGDSATVSVREKKSGETMTFSLKKEKGEWKVAFDMSTLINMGLEKMKEKDINGSDKVKEAMEDMKELGLDSLKNNLREGMKALDSVSKVLQQLNTKGSN
jgi:hypothetical protein